MLLKENDVVLFQGDSITDCGRNYNDAYSLGDGYAQRVAGELGMHYPNMNLKFFNRGISGNRAIDLVNRWQTDCIELKPTVLCIYIGINDVWRRYDSGSITTAEEFEKNYRVILDEAKAKLNCKIIIFEPFVLPVSDIQRKWREDLDPKIEICRRLACEYNALLLPLDGIFASAFAKKGGTYWTGDGVHPSNFGHALISKKLIELLNDN